MRRAVFGCLARARGWPLSSSFGRVRDRITKERAYGPQRRLSREDNSPAPRPVKRVAVERRHSAAKGGTRAPTTPGEGFLMTRVSG